MTDPADLARQILERWPDMGFMDAEIERRREHHDIDGLALLCRASWGVAVYRDHTPRDTSTGGDPATALLAEIDRAAHQLAQANQHGRDAAQQTAHRALTDLLSSTAVETARRHQETEHR